MRGMSAVDLTDRDLWAEDRIGDAFARLRREQPISWQPDPTSQGFTAGPGYWAVVRHADVAAVATDAATFSSSPTTSIRDLPPELGEYFSSMVAMDDPRHAHLRRVVSHAFTPRRVRELQDRVTAWAHDLVAAAVAGGRGDAVASLAAALPLQVICELMGIPRDRWDEMAAHGETMGLARDSEALLVAAGGLHDTAAELADRRRASPGDDLTSALVQADVDGQALTPTEIGSFFMLLVVAGAQTTRHAISHGIVTLASFPDQRARWLTDLDGLAPTAADEVIRWATPVRHFRRTATRDCGLGHVEIAAGDKVVMWFTSANRDETVFANPDRFDITRTPNPHLAFGIGPHFCLGAALARHEVAAVLTELLRRSPGYEVEAAEPLTSTFLSGYTRIDVRY